MTCSGFSLTLSSLIRPTAIFHIVDGPSPRGYRAMEVNVPVVRLVCQDGAGTFLIQCPRDDAVFYCAYCCQLKPIWIIILIHSHKLMLRAPLYTVHLYVSNSKVSTYLNITLHQAPSNAINIIRVHPTLSKDIFQMTFRLYDTSESRHSTICHLKHGHTYYVCMYLYFIMYMLHR